MTTTPEVRFCVRYLLEHGVDELNFSEVASSVSISDPEFELVEKPKSTNFYLELAEKLRKLWPSGSRQIGGKEYEWRDSAANLAKRLETLWKERLKSKNYSIEECLSVARRYLSQFENDTKYMMGVKFFIWKQKELVQSDGRIKYVVESKFADMLEGKADDDAVQNEWEEMLNSGNLGEGELI